MEPILRFDHLVLTVASITATCDFYQRTLGFEPREAKGRWALHFGSPPQKINQHQVDRTFEPKAQRPTPGSADLCFITQTSPADTLSHLHSISVSVEQGPVARTGAGGEMTSIYVRDPDGNLIEIAHYD